MKYSPKAEMVGWSLKKQQCPLKCHYSQVFDPVPLQKVNTCLVKSEKQITWSFPICFRAKGAG